MLMEQKYADALCAIIALGFIEQNQFSKDQDILYIYDQTSDAADHTILSNLIQRKFGFPVVSQFQNAKDPTSNRKIFPFIYALPQDDPTIPNGRSFAEALIESSAAADIVQIAETAANSIKAGTNDFRGAYIGGFIDFKNMKLSLLGPSSLYVRSRNYLYPLSPTPQAFAKTFSEYSSVTQSMKIFLQTCASTFHAWDPEYHDLIVSPDLTEDLILAGTADDVDDILHKYKTFSSCHGLVTSMYYHSDVSPTHLKEGVCIEFSLSDGTCKSASCIPCAIFATAQGSPASQVHLGRGDYWNLPPKAIRNGLNPFMESNWRSMVVEYFLRGSNLIVQQQNVCTETMQMAIYRPDYMEKVIPDMFLDALTFEGSFLQKMLKSL